MADLTRRGFLGLFGAASVAAATGLLPALAEVPRIVGDGIYDDTAGVNAFLNKKPVLVSERIAHMSESGAFQFGRATFRMTGPMVIPPGGHVIGLGNGTVFDFSGAESHFSFIQYETDQK